MDTLGNLIDKQLTVVMKIFNHPSDDRIANLADQLGSLTREIDDISGKILTGKLEAKDAIRPQHKTY